MSMLTWLTRGPKTRSGASSSDTESLIEESLQETNGSATDKGDSEVRSKSLLPTRAESTTLSQESESEKTGKNLFR